MKGIDFFLGNITSRIIQYIQYKHGIICILLLLNQAASYIVRTNYTGNPFQSCDFGLFQFSLVIMAAGWIFIIIATTILICCRLHRTHLPLIFFGKHFVVFVLIECGPFFITKLWLPIRVHSFGHFEKLALLVRY
jgi:hypothetical protein